MINYLQKNNPYEYPEVSWYNFNNMMYLCDILTKDAGVEEEVLEEFVTEFEEAQSDEEQLTVIYTILSYLGVEDVGDFDCPLNNVTDILADTSTEDIPKVYYLLTNPQEKNIPINFNALTYPNYFLMAPEEDDQVSRDMYSAVLKKTLDSRSHTLDARKFNTGLTPEQIAAIATNSLDLSTDMDNDKALPASSKPMIQSLEESKYEEDVRDINFSPNSVVNKSNVSVLPESLNTDSKGRMDFVVDSTVGDILKKDKNIQVTKKPQLKLEDLLNDSEK